MPFFTAGSVLSLIRTRFYGFCVSLYIPGLHQPVAVPHHQDRQREQFPVTSPRLISSRIVLTCFAALSPQADTSRDKDGKKRFNLPSFVFQNYSFRRLWFDNMTKTVSRRGVNHFFKPAIMAGKLPPSALTISFATAGFSAIKSPICGPLHWINLLAQRIARSSDATVCCQLSLLTTLNSRSQPLKAKFSRLVY